jgi:hypothetical protein
VTPERERPSAWGDPAPVYESGPEPHLSESPPPDTDGNCGRSPHESPDPTGDGNANPSGSPTEDKTADLGTGYEDGGRSGEVSAHELAGESIEGVTATHTPLSPNGSGAAGGLRFSQSWPLGSGHASVTKRREHRILRGVRSVVVLAVIALALGVATAASLGLIVWLIATAIHHAASN